MDIKRQAVMEYLTEGFTYRQLAKKYGVSRSPINTWVLVHQGIHDLPHTTLHSYTNFTFSGNRCFDYNSH